MLFADWRELKEVAADAAQSHSLDAGEIEEPEGQRFAHGFGEVLGGVLEVEAMQPLHGAKRLTAVALAQLRHQLAPFQAREALDSHVLAKLDGVVRELRLVVLKKDDCVYDFALITSRQAFDGADSVFANVLDSFEVR